MLTARRRGCQHCAPPLACRERSIAVIHDDRALGDSGALTRPCAKYRGHAPRSRRAPAAPGARRTLGGLGGADAAVREVSRSCPEIEARPGCAGARRTLGGLGAMSGPPCSFDRADCEAGDEAVEEEIVEDGHRDAG